MSRSRWMILCLGVTVVSWPMIALGGGGSTCGDGSCDSASEDCETCEQDCGACGGWKRLGVIGDSIAQGHKAKCSRNVSPGTLAVLFVCDGADLFGDQPHFAFGQGTEPVVNSLQTRLTSRGDLPFGQIAVSVSGDKWTGDGPSQARALCDASHRPNRVLVMLGHNDICGVSQGGTLPSVNTIGNAIRDTLDTLGTCLESGAEAMVMPMVRVDFLKEAGLAKPGSNCSNEWSKGSWWGSGGGWLCEKVTRGSTAALLDSIGEHVNAINERMAYEVNAANSRYPSVSFTSDYTGPCVKIADPADPGAASRDSDGDGVADNWSCGNTSAGDHMFIPADLSVDCFHPRHDTGHRKAACMESATWLNSTSPAGCTVCSDPGAACP